MITEVKMFTVVCDNCGKDSNEGSDYSCWTDESTAKEMAMNADWIEDGNKDYCPDCVSYDDEDNLVLRKKVLK